MKRNLLLTPGPTKIPPEVCEALGRPIIHHRTPQFQDNLKSAIEGLQYVFQTENDVYLLVASGTGAMEASVVNLLSPGEKAITVEGGKFGERWTEICQAYGIATEVIEVEWGTAVKPEQIADLLEKNPDVKAVFTTLSETSTGVVSDIEAIAKVVQKTDAVLVVDAISGLGVTDLQMDKWGVDVVVAASHKRFMLPPGLAFVAVNDKATAMINKSTNARFYWDFRKSKKAFEQTDTPFTPAIGIVVALNESLRIIKEAGRENLLEQYAKLARGTRAAALALGFELLAEDSCISNVLTAIKLPDTVDGGKVVKTMRDTYGISVAGGQGHLKGKIIRIAHMGCVSEEDIIEGIECLQTVLAEQGYSFPANAGVDAAKNEFSKTQTHA